jgi:flagellar biosynthesis GTPase FlhF
MSTSAQSTATETDTRPGEVRTYRGRTVEELIPRIRAELGPGAMILRERQGLTGGVGGFFAKRCVEIDAQSAPRLSVYADDQDESPVEPVAGPTTPDPFAGFAARLEQAANGAFATTAMDDPFAPAAPAPTVPAPTATVPTPAPPAPTATVPTPTAPTPAVMRATQILATIEATPTLMPSPSGAIESTPTLMPSPSGAIESTPALAARAATVAPPTPPAREDMPIFDPQPVAAPMPADFIAFDELEPEPEPLPTAVFSTEAIEPEPEPVELTIPIMLDVAPGTVGAGSVFRPRPLEADGAERPSAFRSVPERAMDATSASGEVDAETNGTESSGAERLRDRLTGHGLSGGFADQLITRATAAAGAQEESMLTNAAQAALAAMLPQAEPLPVDGGVIAVVGPCGSGKTRTVAALAAAYARAGHGVTVARLGAADRGDELTELLEGTEVELIPALKTKATVRAVNAAREEDLVILDTPSTTPGDESSLEALIQTLARFSPDRVLLCAPATFTQRALAHLVEHHAALQIGGLIATHGDQAGMLGTVAELSIETRIPLGHTHAGLDIAHAISRIEPGSLTSDLLR